MAQNKHLLLLISKLLCLILTYLLNPRMPTPNWSPNWSPCSCPCSPKSMSHKRSQWCLNTSRFHHFHPQNTLHVSGLPQNKSQSLYHGMEGCTWPGPLAASLISSPSTLSHISWLQWPGPTSCSWTRQHSSCSKSAPAIPSVWSALLPESCRVSSLLSQVSSVWRKRTSMTTAQKIGLPFPFLN